MTTDSKHPKAGGRKPKADPCSHRYSFNLNDADNAQFMSLFDASGLKDKAHFITSCIFNKELKVIKIDKAAMDLPVSCLRKASLLQIRSFSIIYLFSHVSNSQVYIIIYQIRQKEICKIFCCWIRLFN